METCEKNSLAPKNHRLQATSPLDLVIQRGRKRDNAPGIHAQFFTVQFLLHNRAACVHKGHAVTNQPLENKPFTAEKTRPQSFLESNPDICAKRGSEK